MGNIKFIVSGWDGDRKYRPSRNVWEVKSDAKEELSQLEASLTKIQGLHVEYFTDEKDWNHKGEWIGGNPHEDYDEVEEIANAYNHGMY